MTRTLRHAGSPSPLAAETHDVPAGALPEPIPFDQAVAGSPERHGISAKVLEAWREANGLPRPTPAIPLDPRISRLEQLARLIRPICVGALMAIPTLGTASVGVVSAIWPERGRAMAEASVLFLRGMPTDVVLLIGCLATGYGFAKTFETLKGKRGA